MTNRKVNELPLNILLGLVSFMVACGLNCSIHKNITNRKTKLLLDMNPCHLYSRGKAALLAEPTELWELEEAHESKRAKYMDLVGEGGGV